MNIDASQLEELVNQLVDRVRALEDESNHVTSAASSIDSDLMEFDGITGKKTKDGGLTHANVADAIAKKHITNKDQYLDQGGTNQCAVADIKNAITKMNGGWVPDTATWTYASSDGPSGTFTVSGDVTARLYRGVKIKLTQTSVKYFVVVGSSYSAPNTTVTVYGGTDYALANAAISSTSWSTEKAPAGFPLSEAKWTLSVLDTFSRTQASPVAGTKYNLGSVSLIVYPGLWRVKYSVNLKVTKASAGAVDEFVTLSNANNTELDKELTGFIGHSSATAKYGTVEISNYILDLSVKATYYLNAWTAQAGVANIYFQGDLEKTAIKAVCALL